MNYSKSNKKIYECMLNILKQKIKQSDKFYNLDNTHNSIDKMDVNFIGWEKIKVFFKKF